MSYYLLDIPLLVIFGVLIPVGLLCQFFRKSIDSTGPYNPKRLYAYAACGAASAILALPAIDLASAVLERAFRIPFPIAAGWVASPLIGEGCKLIAVWLLAAIAARSLTLTPPAPSPGTATDAFSPVRARAGGILRDPIDGYTYAACAGAGFGAVAYAPVVASLAGQADDIFGAAFFSVMLGCVLAMTHAVASIHWGASLGEVVANPAAPPWPIVARGFARAAALHAALNGARVAMNTPYATFTGGVIATAGWIATILGGFIALGMAATLSDSLKSTYAAPAKSAVRKSRGGNKGKGASAVDLPVVPRVKRQKEKPTVTQPFQAQATPPSQASEHTTTRDGFGRKSTL